MRKDIDNGQGNSEQSSSADWGFIGSIWVPEIIKLAARFTAVRVFNFIATPRTTGVILKDPRYREIVGFATNVLSSERQASASWTSEGMPSSIARTEYVVALIILGSWVSPLIPTHPALNFCLRYRGGRLGVGTRGGYRENGDTRWRPFRLEKKNSRSSLKVQFPWFLLEHSILSIPSSSIPALTFTFEAS